jgi:CRP-like cAMP-binding protein
VIDRIPPASIVGADAEFSVLVEPSTRAPRAQHYLRLLSGLSQVCLKFQIHVWTARGLRFSNVASVQSVVVPVQDRAASLRLTTHRSAIVRWFAADAPCRKSVLRETTMTAISLVQQQPRPMEARPGPAAAMTTGLAGIAILGGLAPAELATLARRCRWRRYGAGQTILQYGDSGRDVYFVVHGRACAMYHSASGREVRFGDLYAGAVFGEFAAIDGAPHMADVVCVTDALVAAMPAELFREVLHRHATVCAAVLCRLTGIARTMSRRVIEFSTLPVRHRIHAELLRLARSDTPGPQRRTAAIAPAPTHAEIASRISTHREAVSRELADLTRHGVIERRGSDLIVHDVRALARMVEEALEEPSDEADAGLRPGVHRADSPRNRSGARCSEAHPF